MIWTENRWMDWRLGWDINCGVVVFDIEGMWQTIMILSCHNSTSEREGTWCLSHSNRFTYSLTAVACKTIIEMAIK